MWWSKQKGFPCTTGWLHCWYQVMVVLTSNLLKLNDTKTDVLIISSPHYLQAVTDIHIQVGDVSIASSKSVKNLGVLFDQTLGLKQHITHICQSAFMQLRNIRCLKQYLSADALVTVAHAFISSRLDYCNSLLVGIPDNCCVKLQRVQNCTARLVTNTRKYDHIMPRYKAPPLASSQATHYL